MTEPTPDELQAVKIAEGFEGFSATPYLDTLAKPPVWTIGYGSTRVAGDGDPVTADTPPIDQPTAEQWAAVELAAAAAEIARDVTVPLTDAQKAALEDFIYNLGAGAFRSSTLLRLLNQGDLAGAAGQFERWDHAGGVVIAGLLRRRQAERDAFIAGEACAAPATTSNQGAST